MPEVTPIRDLKGYVEPGQIEKLISAHRPASTGPPASPKCNCPVASVCVRRPAPSS